MALSLKKLEGIITAPSHAQRVFGQLMTQVDRDDDSFIGFDTETDGWSPDDNISAYEHAIVNVFSLSDGKEAWCIDGGLLGMFKPLFERGGIGWDGLNLPFDIAALSNHGIRLKGQLNMLRISPGMLLAQSGHVLGPVCACSKQCLLLGSVVTCSLTMSNPQECVKSKLSPNGKANIKNLLTKAGARFLYSQRRWKK